MKRFTFLRVLRGEGQQKARLGAVAGKRDHGRLTLNSYQLYRYLPRDVLSPLLLSNLLLRDVVSLRMYAAGGGEVSGSSQSSFH